MTRKNRNRKPPESTIEKKRAGGGKYSAGELFIALLGAAFVVLILGIIVTALLGG